MLKVWFFITPENSIHPQGYFDHVYEDEWLYDPDVIQIVRDIDKSELKGQCVISPVLGSIAVTQISGGAKGLILLLKEDGVMFDLVTIGQNCVPWLARISQMKDIEVCMNGVDLRFDGYDFDSMCMNDGTIMHNGIDLTNKMLDYSFKEMEKY